VPGTRGLLFAAAAAGCALLAACSSGPSAASVSQQAATARAAALPAAKQLHAQVASGGVGWSAAIIGDYENCGEDDPQAANQGTGMLQYTASELMIPFDRKTPLATFTRQVTEVLNAAGWKLSPQAGGAAYAGHSAGFDLRVVAGDRPTLGPTADVFLSGACFNAGSAASSYIGPSPRDDIPQPRPTVTPSPRYS
jgi:hypothetical protein